jgi:hypothetical protein
MPTTAHEPVSPRKRRRTNEEGHMVFNTTAPYGRCITTLAEREGLSVASYLRQMVVRCLKEEGWTWERVQEEFGVGVAGE